MSAQRRTDKPVGAALGGWGEKSRHGLLIVAPAAPRRPAWPGLAGELANAYRALFAGRHRCVSRANQRSSLNSGPSHGSYSGPEDSHGRITADVRRSFLFLFSACLPPSGLSRIKTAGEDGNPALQVSPVEELTSQLPHAAVGLRLALLFPPRDTTGPARLAPRPIPPLRLASKVGGRGESRSQHGKSSKIHRSRWLDGHFQSPSHGLRPI